MASASAASTALPVAGGSRPSMDTDFNPAGNRPEHGHGQMRESSRSSRRKPSGSSSAVQYSLPSPSQASFELKPPSRPFAAASPISPSAGQSSLPTPIRGAHFLPPSSTPSPPFGRPVQQRTPSYGYPSHPQQHQRQQTPGSNGSLNLEVSPSPASRQTQRRESGSSPTPGRRMHAGGHSPGQISVPRQPPPPMLTSLPLPPTPERAPVAGEYRQRLPAIESLSAAGTEAADVARFPVNDEVPRGWQNPPVPAPMKAHAASAACLTSTPEKQQKPKPLLKAGPVSLLVAPGARRGVLSVHSQVAVLEGEGSPSQTSPARRLFEQQHQQSSAPAEPTPPKRLAPAIHRPDDTSLPEQSQPESISPSPQRPSYSRGNTAPLLSPPKSNSDRPQEHIDFTPPPQRPRQASTGLVDRFMGSAPSSEGRQSMLRSQTDSPSKWTRHSEDMLRASTSSPLGKKEMKALEKQQAKAAASSSSLSPQKSALGITPRKSSGGLKALFKKASGQGGKGKEKEKDSGWVEVPPVPAELRRPSQDQRAFENGRPSYSHDGRAMSATPPGGVQRMLPEMERQRSVSQSSLGTSPAPPSRQLPALPPPTPSYSTSDTASPMSPNGELSSQLVTPSTSSTSLQERSDTSPGTGSEASSSTTTGKAPLRPSASLHLLELPELDLSFNFAFDDVRGSPSRAQASPIRPSPKSPSRSNTSVAYTRNRLHAARRRSSSIDGLHSSHSQELWRSSQRSNPGTPTSGVRTLDTSSSNPRLISSCAQDAQASVGVDQASDESHIPSLAAPASGHEQSDSVSSEPSVISTSDHLRTPSNSSWAVEEASSISPPRTPKDDRAVLDSAIAASDGDIRSGANLMVAPTPTPPTAPVSSDKRGVLGRPLSFGPPNSAPEAGPSSPVRLVNSVLAPAADIKTQSPTVAKGASKPTIRPMRTEKRLQSKSRRVMSATIVSQIELASELEQLLFSFRYPSTANKTADRAAIVRSQLLQMLHEGEKRGFDAFDDAGNAALRAVCFDWADALLFELRVEQPAIERGACLEGLAAILETPCLSARAIDSSTQDSASFRGLMVRVIAFVMSKLGAKGVFHNSLLFSGRVLAFAFFRIPHVAQQLLVTLPTQRQALMRFSRAVFAESAVPETACPLSYPPHLREVCFDDSKAYLARLHAHQPSFATPEEQAAFVFRPGNWLRRWQSDDSELFPAFYRAYHRQLAIHLSPAIEYFEARSQPIPASILLRAPGYAHLASVFASKCHSYILGSVNAVTTSSSSQAFDATESAGFRGNAKPAVLETANRRLSETMLSFANSRLFIDQTFGGVVEVDGSQLWANMIECWIKYLISKTSLYAPKGVFCLFDLLDCVTDPPSDTMGASSLQITTTTVPESLLDVPHLISVIRIVLTEGEHALTLVKIIAFVFTHYETLCARAEDRKELCINLLLDKQLFERLVLFWSQSVRSYILRLIVFRLGHLHTTAAEGDSHEVEIATVRLLNARLDRIRKRHEELEPGAEEDDHPLTDNLSLTDVQDGGDMPRSRSTITMISPASPRVAAVANNAERLRGLGFGGPPESKSPDAGREAVNTPMGKATSWIKKSFGKQKKTKGLLGDDSSSQGTASPSVDSSPRFDISPRMDNSPTAGGSPPTPAAAMEPRASAEQPYVREAAIPTKAAVEAMQSPVSSHSSEGESPMSANSFEGESQFLQAYHKKMALPSISTTSPDKSAAFFAFEFELPTQSPRSDSFDPAPSPPSLGSGSAPPSPRQPPSPHMSRSFSKRSSLLPPPTASVLDSILASPAYEASPGGMLVEAVEEEGGYDAKLHAYAIRMLAELEDAQREYDEWWSDGGIGRLDNAPPRLTVAWPFSDDEE